MIIMHLVRFLFLKSVSSPHHASAFTGEMRGLRKLLWTLDSSDSSLHYVFIVLCVYCTVCLLHCVFLALLTRKFVLLCSKMEIAKKKFSTKMKISLIQHAAKRELERRPTHRSLHWVICNICKLGKVLVVVNKKKISLADSAIFAYVCVCVCVCVCEHTYCRCVCSVSTVCCAAMLDAALSATCTAHHPDRHPHPTHHHIHLWLFSSASS